MKSILILNIILIQLLRTIFCLQCDWITVKSCQGLGYNMTALPNLANHQNQLDAELELTHLLPLLESNCSQKIRFLLCSSLFPLCSIDFPKPVTACKSLCENVKNDCSQNENYTELMKLWPIYLNCDLLTQPEKHELCMQIPKEDLQSNNNKLILPSSSNYNTNQFWPLSIWKNHQLSTDNQKQHHNHHNHHEFDKKFNNHHMKSTLLINEILCPDNFTSINNDYCIPKCNTNTIYNQKHKKFTETLILILSIICFIITLFSLVTFWAEPTRFGYPERPVLFLCLCYNLLSICYLERLIFHNTLNDQQHNNQHHHPAHNNYNNNNEYCLLTPPCLASYITNGYLTLCASFWWLIFALCFYLSSNQKWSSEALEKKSSLFHILAWLTPLLPPILALLFNGIEFNQFTSMCVAFGYVEIPTLILLIIGTLFIYYSIKSLQNLQHELSTTSIHLQYNHNSYNNQLRFLQIRQRILIFSLVYLIPTILAIILTFFENYYIKIPKCLNMTNCQFNAKNYNYQLMHLPTYLRLFFHLIGGTLTGMWVWSRKTCESYRNRITTTSSPTSSSFLTTGLVGGGGPVSLSTNNTITNHHHHHNNINANTNTTFTFKSGTLLTKKPVIKQQTLYSGINFHNVPIYNNNQSSRIMQQSRIV